MESPPFSRFPVWSGDGSEHLAGIARLKIAPKPPPNIPARAITTNCTLGRPQPPVQTAPPPRYRHVPRHDGDGTSPLLISLSERPHLAELQSVPRRANCGCEISRAALFVAAVSKFCWPSPVVVVRTGPEDPKLLRSLGERGAWDTRGTGCLGGGLHRTLVVGRFWWLAGQAVGPNCF